MKTLTIKQPWAGLILAGPKNVENRTWMTRYRGQLAIHVAVNRTSKAALDLVPGDYTDLSYELWASNQHAGHVIGVVDLVDIVEDSPSPWALPDNHHWMLANPCKLDRPIQATGRLGLWDFPLPWRMVL